MVLGAASVKHEREEESEWSEAENGRTSMGRGRKGKEAESVG